MNTFDFHAQAHALEELQEAMDALESGDASFIQNNPKLWARVQETVHSSSMEEWTGRVRIQLDNHREWLRRMLPAEIDKRAKLALSEDRQANQSLSILQPHLEQVERHYDALASLRRCAAQTTSSFKIAAERCGDVIQAQEEDLLEGKGRTSVFASISQTEAREAMEYASESFNRLVNEVRALPQEVKSIFRDIQGQGMALAGFRFEGVELFNTHTAQDCIQACQGMVQWISPMAERLEMRCESLADKRADLRISIAALLTPFRNHCLEALPPVLAELAFPNVEVPVRKRVMP